MSPKTKFTACKDCKFIVETKHTKTSFYDNSWGYHCKVNGKDKAFDFIGGKYVETCYPNCRVINNGICKFFKSK